MKLGIIGTGKIVTEALPVIGSIDEIMPVAILARPQSLARGKELAERHDIPEVYTAYEELLSKADIDTVYIGLVNSVHYEYAKLALEYGKNVILEKPFTDTAEEAEDLFRTAIEHRCFIFEAITPLHSRVFEKMRANLPKLGRIRMMQANFSQYSSRYDRYMSGIADPSFDPECRGGSLRDINVYNIHFAAALFGSPENAFYYPNRGWNGIDTSGVMILAYDGFSCVCTAAKDSDSPCFVMVQGEKGYMRMDSKPNAPDDLTVVIRGEEGVTECFKEEYPHRMTAEFVEFERIIREKDYRRASYFTEETLEVVKILEKL